MAMEEGEGRRLGVLALRSYEEPVRAWAMRWD